MLAWDALNPGELAEARRRFEELLRAARVREDRDTIAALLKALGRVALEQWDLATARSCLEESLAAFQRENRQSEVAGVLGALWQEALQAGDRERADALAVRVRAVREGGGLPGDLRATLRDLGEAAWQDGEYE